MWWAYMNWDRDKYLSTCIPCDSVKLLITKRQSLWVHGHVCGIYFHVKRNGFIHSKTRKLTRKMNTTGTCYIHVTRLTDLIGCASLMKCMVWMYSAMWCRTVPSLFSGALIIIFQVHVGFWNVQTVIKLQAIIGWFNKHLIALPIDYALVIYCFQNWKWRSASSLSSKSKWVLQYYRTFTSTIILKKC